VEIYAWKTIPDCLYHGEIGIKGVVRMQPALQHDLCATRADECFHFVANFI